MSTPIDPMSAEYEWFRWKQDFERHVGQIPQLLEAMRATADPLRAGRTEVKITGGGYFDQIPISDTSAANDCEHLWRLLARYVHAVGAAMRDTSHPVLIPPTGRIEAPDGAVAIRRAAQDAVAWIETRINDIADHKELQPAEDELFAAVRRGTLRYRSGGPAHADPRPCGRCLAKEVVIDWTTSENRTPKPTAKCRACGQEYPVPPEALAGAGLTA